VDGISTEKRVGHSGDRKKADCADHQAQVRGPISSERGRGYLEKIDEGKRNLMSNTFTTPAPERKGY